MSAIRGTCELCDAPATTAMRWWRGGWVARLRAPQRLSCGEHISDLIAILRGEIKPGSSTEVESA